MSNTRTGKYEVDMINGPLLGKIITYAIPIMLSGILQLTFNAVDLIIVGRFTGSEAMAAVGSTGSLINLLVNLFNGLAVGANVLVAKSFGANQMKSVKESVHTAIAISIIGGIFLVFVGLIFSRPILTLMGTPSEIIDNATLYLRIYFSGMPIFMLYNFGSAILRAVGDTRRPLYFLSLAGVINVILNYILVRFLYLGVAGVAIATVISQGVAVILVLRTLMKSDGAYKLILKEIKVNKDKLLKMLRIGLPAGLQGCLFSISNVLIQSSVNSFGATVVAGNTAASNIEGIVYTGMNSVYQTAISFVGQNYGAGKYKRIKKVSAICLSLVVVIGVTLNTIMMTFAEPLLSLYGTTGEEISFGILRMQYVCKLYFLCGIMDVLVGLLRGMGYAIMPMIVSLSGACLFRVIWVTTIFKHFNTLQSLYISYPISWLLTSAAHTVCLLYVLHKIKGRFSE